MTGTLLHANSQLVSREELLTIPPPPGTETWKPIAHADLIQALDRQLMVRAITIQKEQFAVQRNGARLFAVLDLSLEEDGGEYCAAMGIRTANDRSMALEIAVGVKVFVCDNLAFSGDLIALRRKHTSKFDLNADMSRAVDRYQAHLVTFQGQLAELKERVLSDEEAKVKIFDAFAEEVLHLRFLPIVGANYFRSPGTSWDLLNAFTAALKQMAPAPAFAASTRLGRFFGLRAGAS